MEENKKDLIDVDFEMEKMFEEKTDIALAIERKIKEQYDKISEWQANCEAELRNMKKKLDSIPIQNDDELNFVTENVVNSTINCTEQGGEI